MAGVSAVRIHSRRFRRNWVIIFFSILVLYIAYLFLLAPPSNFVPGSVVVIPQGTSAVQAGHILTSAHIVREGPVISFLWRFSGKDISIHPGAYRFDAPENVFKIASRVTQGLFGIPPIKITIIEGETVRDMSEKVSSTFPEISASDFITAAGPYEGYLFPDTYLFPPDATAKSIVEVMRANFEKKIVKIKNIIVNSNRSENDIIIMASIIEREARTDTSKRMVSGILWNRIDRNMLLQVDAIFGYIFGRDTYSPSFKDLGVDSPYNTYIYKGLPPGPIDSPGLSSIEAAAKPTKSSYLFYLTGNDGKMHYARTYAVQLKNQRKYLK